MAKKNFLLLSLDDSQAKKVANIMGNDSCRKILDYLADREATESELSKNLSIPISTVHYNLQQLMDAKLIDSEEFHYSPKGREVSHYRLANKYIIITPKKVTGIKQKLMGILPAVLLAAGVAGIIQLVSRYAQEPVMETMAAKSMAYDSFAMAAPAVQTSIWQSTALWFLIGALFGLAAYSIIKIARKEP